MVKEEVVEKEGVVLRILGNARFRIRTDDDIEVTAYTGGKLKQNDIRIVVGDRVRIKCNTVDPTRGRIIFRGITARAKS